RCGGTTPADMRFCTNCGFAYGKADAASPSPKGRTPAAPRLIAVMKDGSDGQVYEFESPTLDLGRTEGDVVLADDPYLSDRHARFHWEGDQVSVRDLDSFNGVYVRIREAVELADRDTILIGQQVL